MAPLPLQVDIMVALYHQGGVTHTDSIVTAATVQLDPLYCMARNFQGLKISRFSWINLKPRNFILKILPLKFLITRTAHTRCVVLLVSTWSSVILVYTLLSCCVAMALYRYFQTWEKSSCKLANPRGPLSRLVPSSLILSGNEKVQSVLESKECTQSGWKGKCYSKVSPELKAEIGRWAAEHGVAATVRLYAKKLPDCWAMGVVNLQLEVGGTSMAWRSSRLICENLVLKISSHTELKKRWRRMHLFINVCVVNGQWLKCSKINGPSPEYQHGQWSNCQKELVKLLQLWL